MLQNLIFMVLRLKKDFKIFFRVKFPKKYAHGRIFEKKLLSEGKKIQNLAETVKFWPKMGKNRTFIKKGPTDEFQTKFSGFSIQFEYRNCKNIKRFL